MKIPLDIPLADAPVTEAELMDKVLPGLFVNTAAISTYGRQVGTSTAMAELDRLMESSPVSRLAKLLREIVAKLRDADPELVSRKPSFLARVLGADVEQRVVYDTARSTLDTLLAQAEEVEQEVRAAIDLTDRLIGSHDEEVVWLELHVRCGRRFLEMHSQAAAQPGTPTMFESPHARLERRLDNLETLRLSHEMSLTQMRLCWGPPSRLECVHALEIRLAARARILARRLRLDELAAASLPSAAGREQTEFLQPVAARLLSTIQRRTSCSW